jgi:hypothetical protein
MKLKIKGITTKVTLFTAILLGACLFAGSANAQSTFSGKFTLRYSVRWGQTTLGAGDYTVKINPINGSSSLTAIIYHAPSGKVAGQVTCANVDSAKKGQSALLIGHRGNMQVVHSFRVADLGETFIYDRTLASRQTAEESLNPDDVPVLDAKKQ